MKLSKLVAILAVTLVFACTTEDQTTENNDLDNELIFNSGSADRVLVTDQALLDEIAKLDLDTGLITKGDFHRPDGTVEQRYWLGDDINISPKELQALIDQNNSDAKQFRTFNLVSLPNQTIDILGYIDRTTVFSLTTKGQNALTLAVANYNNLNTGLQFNLTFGNDLASADMVVFDNTFNIPSPGGSAGFPTAAGAPHDFIQIHGLDSFSLDVNEHVITHEIGHSIGFRHTDWFDRLSCSSTVSYEGYVRTIGAIHVPGTPTDRDLTSIMQACFNTSVSGEFNANDVTALEFMYPIGGTTGPCDGVPEWESTATYSVGDRVTYYGNLYEWTGTGWLFISAC